MIAMLVSEDIDDQGNGRTAFREWTVRFDLIARDKARNGLEAAWTSGSVILGWRRMRVASTVRTMSMCIRGICINASAHFAALG
jgi:hypothetical protein